MKVKEESEKVGLKFNIQKTKIMASGPILENTHGQRSLVGYSSRGLKDSDTTERLRTEQHENLQLMDR